MKSKPYGIFEIVNDKTIPISSVNDALEQLLIHIKEGRKGYKDEVWTWDEVVVSISNYISIMKQELKGKQNE